MCIECFEWNEMAFLNEINFFLTKLFQKNILEKFASKSCWDFFVRNPVFTVFSCHVFFFSWSDFSNKRFGKVCISHFFAFLFCSHSCVPFLCSIPVLVFYFVTRHFVFDFVVDQTFPKNNLEKSVSTTYRYKFRVYLLLIALNYYIAYCVKSLHSFLQYVPYVRNLKLILSIVGPKKKILMTNPNVSQILEWIFVVFK